MTKFKYPYVNLSKQHKPLNKNLHKALDRILDSGNFVLGSELEKFEEEFANYLGVKYAIGVGNGTDALYLSLKALNIGKDDEVITVANSYLASASSIALCGAKPAMTIMLLRSISPLFLNASRKLPPLPFESNNNA